MIDKERYRCANLRRHVEGATPEKRIRTNEEPMRNLIWLIFLSKLRLAFLK